MGFLTRIIETVFLGAGRSESLAVRKTGDALAHVEARAVGVLTQKEWNHYHECVRSSQNIHQVQKRVAVSAPDFNPKKNIKSTETRNLQKIQIQYELHFTKLSSCKDYLEKKLDYHKSHDPYDYTFIYFICLSLACISIFIGKTKFFSKSPET